MLKLEDWILLDVPEPMQCDDAHRFLEALLYEEPMPPEVKGMLLAHLDSCERCTAAFADLIEAAHAEHKIVVPDAPPFPWSDGIGGVPADDDVELSDRVYRLSDRVYRWSALRRLANRLERLREAGQKTAQVAFQEMESIREGLQDMILLAAPERAPSPGWQHMGGATLLGEDAGEPFTVDVMEGDKPVAAEAITPPEITAGGEFHLTVRTRDIRVNGHRLQCQLYAGNGNWVACDDVPFAEEGSGHYVAAVTETGMPIVQAVAYPVAISSYFLKLELKP